MIPISQIETNKGQIEGLPKNPRLIRDEHFKKLLQSIKDNPEMLYLRELLVYPHEAKYITIGGNMRLMAMRDLGYTEAPCKVIPEDTSIEQLKAYTIKDNAAYGEWDYDLLANEWDEVQLDDWCLDIPDTNAVNPTSEAHEDDFGPDKPVETVCKKGDIWKLGNHRLMCGDSTDAGSVALLMEGKEARLVVTSPPYGVGKSYEQAGIDPWKNTTFKVIENITKHARIVVWNIGDLFATGTQFYEPTSMYSTEHFEKCGFLPMYARIWKKQGGNFAGTNPYYTVSMKPVQEYEWILCYGKKDYEKDYMPIIEFMSNEAKRAQLDNAILKEVTGAGFMYGHWFTPHQWAMIDEENYLKIARYCEKEKIDAFKKEYAEIRRWYENLNIFGKVLTKAEESEWGQWSIWNINTVNKRTGGHPAEFPVELPWRCIKMHSREDDIVLEPFGGSGTTLIAAEQLNRRCFMMELDPHYCDVIIARWEQFTGQKAKLLTNAKTAEP